MRANYRTLAILFALTLPLSAQQVTGSISGVVLDPTSRPIAEAAVTLTDTAGRNERQITSATDGTFIFTAVPPGTYKVAITAPGFSRLLKDNVVLPASERLSLGGIQLVVGQIADTISVTAEGTTVQSESSERSGLVTSKQVENLAVVNRNFSVLVSLLPGVATGIPPDTTGYSGGMTFNVQGGRQTANNFTLDGLPVADLGAAVSSVDFVSMDSVSEVKILVSNFQAEFGRKPGASVQAITKSGNDLFHGTGYWYQRNEDLNANNFFNNRSGPPNPKYRYTTAGGNIGGPVLIPHLVDGRKSKLFFFFGAEKLSESRPGSILNLTMPTEAERNGDFSNSRNVNGSLIVINDPTTGKPFAGNVIPVSRINAAGQGFLKQLPLPNYFNTTISGNAYNYQFQESLNVPKNNETVRVDYALTPKVLWYARFNNWWEEASGYAVSAGGPAWPWVKSVYNDTNKSGVLNGTFLLSPTTVVEVSSGYMRYQEADPLSQDAIDGISRTATGVNLPQLYPQYNPLNLLPQVTFGGRSNTPSITYDGRFPITGLDRLWTWNGAITRVQGAHTLKTGIWAERALNNKGANGNFAGTYDFSRTVTNPLDSNDPFSNAMLGNFASYTESTSRPAVQARSTLAEWYLQDTWKVTRRLTLDLGIRFGWAQPYYNKDSQMAGFVPSLWNASQAVQLIQPAIVSGQRVGRNPITGDTVSAALIGGVAPGAGNVSNGIVYIPQSPDYPKGLRDSSGIKTAPRIGFAYDPFGKGKTVIRGGFGVFYEMREMGIRQFNLYSNPPIQLNPVIYYGNISTLLGSAGTVFPSAVTGLDRNWPVARTLNVNFGIQQNIGKGTVVDISYGGALGRHLQQGQNLNAIPAGADFAAANQDPTTPGKPLAAAFLRPYAGYNNISYYSNSGNSSYHSLQVSANRRFAHGLLFGLAWTWSKAMDYTDTNTDLVSTLVDPKVWNYGLAGFDRTHIFKLNFTYQIPAASNLLPSSVVKALFDNWELSGVTSMQSGTPLPINLSFVNSVDITGSPTDGARVVVLSNPSLSKGDRTFSRNFDTAAFGAPSVGGWGNAAKFVVRGPGLNNWDLALFKNIPFKNDRLKAQLRGEFYNAFNHTQFTSWNTNATFDATGKQANSLFGQDTAAAPARRIQIALRFQF